MLNLGIEGTMYAGAFVGFLVAFTQRLAVARARSRPSSPAPLPGR